MTVPLKSKHNDSNSFLVLCFAAVYLIWGSTFLGIRIAIESLPPFLMAGFRFAVAGAFFYVWARFQGAPAPSAVHWRSTGLLGVLLIFCGNGFVTWAEQGVPSGVAALFIATTPLWMVLLENWARGSLLPPARVASGIALGFAGVFLLLDPRGILNHGSVHPAGALALLFSAFSWALGSFLSRRLSLPSSSIMAAGMQMLTGGLLLLAAGSVRGEGAQLNLSQVSPRSWMALAYLIVFGSWVAFSAYHWILRKSTLEKASTYAFVNPAVAVFLGWFFAGEAVTPKILLATTLILLSVALILGLHRFRLQRPKTFNPLVPKPVGQVCAE